MQTKAMSFFVRESNFFGRGRGEITFPKKISYKPFYDQYGYSMKSRQKDAQFLFYLLKFMFKF